VKRFFDEECTETEMELVDPIWWPLIHRWRPYEKSRIYHYLQLDYRGMAGVRPSYYTESLQEMFIFPNIKVSHDQYIICTNNMAASVCKYVFILDVCQ
jgi:hypothetical protein